MAVSNAVVMATNLSFGDGKKIVVAGHLLKLQIFMIKNITIALLFDSFSLLQ